MAICLWLGAKAASILGSFSFSCLVNTPVVVKWVDGLKDAAGGWVRRLGGRGGLGYAVLESARLKRLSEEYRCANTDALDESSAMGRGALTPRPNGWRVPP